MLKLDLNNLTPVHLEEAHANCHSMGCMYQAPCIIGSLMTTEQRLHFDNIGGHLDGVDEYPQLSDLIDKGHVQMPKGQRDDAVAMQQAFDSNNWTTVERIAGRYANA